MTTQFDADTSAEEAARNIDLSDQTIVITGGSAGLGVENPPLRPPPGAPIVRGGSNEAKPNAAAATIHEADLHASP